MTHVTCRLSAKKPGSAPKPYARQSSVGYLYLFTHRHRQTHPRDALPWHATATPAVLSLMVSVIQKYNYLLPESASQKW